MTKPTGPTTTPQIAVEQPINERALMRGVRKFFRRATVKNPSAVATQPAYQGNFPLSGNNFFQALGAPNLTFPGATGVKGGASIEQMQKKQIVYGKDREGPFFDISGGWTYSAFDKMPTGNYFNNFQV